MDLIAPRRVHGSGVLGGPIVQRREHFGDELPPFLGRQRQDVGEKLSGAGRHATTLAPAYGRKPAGFRADRTGRNGHGLGSSSETTWQQTRSARVSDRTCRDAERSGGSARESNPPCRRSRGAPSALKAEPGTSPRRASAETLARARRGRQANRRLTRQGCPRNRRGRWRFRIPDLRGRIPVVDLSRGQRRSARAAWESAPPGLSGRADTRARPARPSRRNRAWHGGGYGVARRVPCFDFDGSP